MKWCAVLSAVIFLLMPTVASSAGDLQFDDAWVRAMPPSQQGTAAYFSVTNRGIETLQIIGVSSDLSPRVEMHSSTLVDGMMRMQQIHSLSVAPGQTIDFTPGGKHLMLMEMERMPQPGEQVELCLHTEGNSSFCTTADVRKSGSDHKHH